MTTTVFRTALGDTPTIRIIETLIEGRGLDHSLTDIAQQAGVGWTTLHRLWPNLERTGLVRQTRQIGRAKLFVLDETHPAAQQLVRLFDTLLVAAQPAMSRRATVTH